MDDGCRNILHFLFERQLYRIKSLIFGLNLAPRTVTKPLRPVMAQLRSLGVILLINFDYLLLKAMSKEGKGAVDKAIVFLINLGHMINFAEALMDPAQLMEWLGHLTNSLRITISLPENKLLNTRSVSWKFLNRSQRGATVTLNELASFVRMLNRCGEAINQARLHSNTVRGGCQQAEMVGWKAGRMFNLSFRSQTELRTWICYLKEWNSKLILQPETAYRITGSDASETRWGGWIMEGPENLSRSETDTTVQASRLWTHRQHRTELKLLQDLCFNLNNKDDINVLEVVGAISTIKTFALLYNWRDLAILHRVDDSVVLPYLNRLEGRV